MNIFYLRALLLCAFDFFRCPFLIDPTYNKGYIKTQQQLFPTDLTRASKTYALACLRQRVVEGVGV